MKNLDALAAKHSQAILAKTIKEAQKNTDVENVVTKALGVMQEQGIYAGMLYLLSRPKKDETIAKAVQDQLVELLRAEALNPFGLAEGLADHPEPQELLNHFATCVCEKNIQTVLLVKNLFEQTLMYARYSAKAQPD